MSHEAIRLVIWDLDETFWRGILSEGGVREYVRAHHDIVVDLARRGIVSSICSKNDRDAVEAILREHDLWDYFVFPSINWEPKGPRIADLVEKIGLRAPTVLFIDDNPGHRAEAAAAVPGLQIADETYIAGMLANPLLMGKDDCELSRLKQYKVLEARRRDEQAVGGANHDFLRNSYICVEFEYNVAAHIDRAIELVNRTNQLNYTKRHLPEDLAMARAALREELRGFGDQAALIRVTDRYGDYGYCGFYLRKNGQGGGPGSLTHYCFSCRTLGMFVEQWVFEHLGRPGLNVVGAVLTDLSQPRDIDWIRMKGAGDRTTEQQRPIPEVKLRGGCEIDALSHYFTAYAETCSREGSIDRGSFFILRDCSHHLVSPTAPPIEDDFLVLAETCGFTREDFDSEIFAPCSTGSLIVYSCWGDIREAYRHKRTGRLLTVCLAGLYEDVTKLSRKKIAALLARQDLSSTDCQRIYRAVDALQQTAEFTGHLREHEVKQNLHRLFTAMPAGCKIAVLAVDEFVKEKSGPPVKNPVAEAYNRWLREAAALPEIKLFSISDYLKSEEERLYTAHFDRIVYFRLASAIIEWATERIEAARPAVERQDALRPAH
jgi:FkbH-like protein